MCVFGSLNGSDERFLSWAGWLALNLRLRWVEKIKNEEKGMVRKKRVL
jgi:hypothetical protein